MTTKEQETKALEKIRAIVAGLGEDSYLAAAFEGCFELAEENIANDWACTPQIRRSEMNAAIDKLNDQIEQLDEQILQRDNQIERLNSLSLESERVIDRMKQMAASQSCEFVRLREKIDSLEEENEALIDGAETQAQRILELKAKLYDYMSAQK
jgi:predicted RNase H-like nuclease (RuvC/YqgF family)